MKRIGIDARLYFQTGVGTYLRNFLRYLQELDTKDIDFYVYVMKEDAAKIQFKKSNFIKREVTYKWHSLSEQVSFPKVLYQDNLDLMHFTYFSYPVLYTKKFIATVHDVTPLLYKTGKASTKNPILFEVKHKAFEFVLRSQVQNATKIITPTETVKKQLGEIYGERVESKIKAIYEGLNFELLEAKEEDLKEQFPFEFFVYVGNFYPHKNVENLLKAYSKVKTDIKLVLVGPQNYFTERLQSQIADLNLKDKVIIYSKAENLVFFYSHAKALINPSLSEGFGLPLIEAAYFNCPVIASDIPVFKELLGEKFVSFDPKDTEDITEKLQNFVKNPQTFNYSDLLKKYSFKQMAEHTLAQYQSLV